MKREETDDPRYLRDYQSYLEDKDNEDKDIDDNAEKENDFVEDKQQLLQNNHRTVKNKHSSGDNTSFSQQIHFPVGPKSDDPRYMELRNNSVDGQLFRKSPWTGGNSLDRLRSESLKTLSSNKIAEDSLDVASATKRLNTEMKSWTDVGSKRSLDGGGRGQKSLSFFFTNPSSSYDSRMESRGVQTENKNKTTVHKSKTDFNKIEDSFEARHTTTDDEKLIKGCFDDFQPREVDKKKEEKYDNSDNSEDDTDSRYFLDDDKLNVEDDFFSAAAAADETLVDSDESMVDLWDELQSGRKNKSENEEKKEEKRIRMRRHVVEYKDFSQQTTETHSTQTPVRLSLRNYDQNHLQRIGTISLGDWLLVDSDDVEGLLLQPWTVLGMQEEEEERKKVAAADTIHRPSRPTRDFATQTFGQVTGIVQTSNETQTENDEWIQFQLTMKQEAELEMNRNKHFENSGYLRKLNLEETKSNGVDQRFVEKNAEEEEEEVEEEENQEEKENMILTEEVINELREARKLVSGKKLTKRDMEMSSGKRELLEIMLREVRNLKNQIVEGEVGDGEERSRYKKEKKKLEQKEIMQHESDSAIESSDGEEEEEVEKKKKYSQRRLQLLYQNPPKARSGRKEIPRQSDKNGTKSERRSRIREQEIRPFTSTDELNYIFHNNQQPRDLRHRQGVAAEHNYDVTDFPPQRYRQLPPPASGLWNRRVEDGHQWHSSRLPFAGPTDGRYHPRAYQMMHAHPSQPPNLLASLTPASVPFHPHTYYNGPPGMFLPQDQYTCLNSALQSRPLQFGQGNSAFRPTTPHLNLQKPSYVFMPNSPAIQTIWQPSVLLKPIDAPAGALSDVMSYQPQQRIYPPLSQTNDPRSHLPQDLQEPTTVGVQQLLAQPFVTGSSSMAVRKKDGRQQKSIAEEPERRTRKKIPPPSRKWKSDVLDFEKSLSKAAEEAEMIRALSDRLQRQSSSPIII